MKYKSSKAALDVGVSWSIKEEFMNRKPSLILGGAPYITIIIAEET